MKKYLMTLVIVIALCVVLCSCAPETIPPTESLDMSEWMKTEISDTTLLKSIKIPGSHDAGSIGMLPMACTQDADIKTQLEKGVRYFDIRVNKISSDGGDKFVIFHEIINGAEFEPIIADIEYFIKTHTGECLILDFQHFKNSSESGVLEIIDKYGLQQYAVTNNTDKSDLEFIDSLTMADCRGKIILLWGNRGNLFDKEYLFRRDNDAGDSGFDTVCKSYYDSNLQKKASADFIDTALPIYFNNRKNFNKGLFVLQCQLTGGALSNLHSLENKHAVNMDAYIKNLKDSELLQYTNIIMRDFITDGDKIKDIVLLNS